MELIIRLSTRLPKSWTDAKGVLNSFNYLLVVCANDDQCIDENDMLVKWQYFKCSVRRAWTIPDYSDQLAQLTRRKTKDHSSLSPKNSKHGSLRLACLARRDTVAPWKSTVAVKITVARSQEQADTPGDSACCLGRNF